MSLLSVIRAKLGLSNTPANNFVLDASADNGTMKLARGNPGATTQDVLTVDAAGNVRFPVTTPGNAPVFGCRAWVTFDGRGAVGTNQTIRSSGNVASVYKVAAGVFKITFTTPMPDANYAPIGTCGSGSAYNRDGCGFVCVSYTGGAPEVTTTDVTVLTTITANGAPYDNTAGWVSVMIMR